jgi:ATP-dependent RNA helicase DDX3X
MAEFLVKILVECSQPVPEFLESYKPAGQELDFDDDSGAEEEEPSGGATGEAWGAGGDTGSDTGGDAAPAAPAQDAWGSNDGAAGGEW